MVKSFKVHQKAKLSTGVVRPIIICIGIITT